MYQISMDKPCHVHFIGIGGISMSGIAQILLSRGFTVSGSDSRESPLTQKLEQLGARVFYGQKAENIPADTDVVVYSAAIHPDNPEYAGAVSRGLPMLRRAQLLGQMMDYYKEAVNVAGTHGKTTTTSLISEVMLEAGKDPTISVGGILPSIGGNVRIGGNQYFIAEACEYTNSFLFFRPTANVVLNVEADHLDFFKNLDDIRHSFRKFCELVPERGFLVINSGIRDLSYFTDGLKCRVITFGWDPDSDYTAKDVTYDEFAHPSFTVVKKGTGEVGRVVMRIPGEHNVLNALAALAVCDQYGIPMAAIEKGISNFTGTERRFERKGVWNGVTVVDDYAHHPQEIEATLKTALRCPHKTLWCVFQPHTYTRTKALMDDFAKALSLADKVVLAKIFPARETDTLGISADDVRRKVEALGKPSWYFETFEDIEKFLRENCVPGDLLITMGAGDVWKVGEDLVRQ
ncbi:MAG: UDP-N-acetylmuramate--L-alanine ligase [Lachnospiraceae bacterium]|jgi:UDP-N-acetylmuramate--alanine ligase